jgi:hypothetical protein
METEKERRKERQTKRERVNTQMNKQQKKRNSLKQCGLILNSTGHSFLQLLMGLVVSVEPEAASQIL